MIEYNGLESYELLPDDYILLEDLWEIFELIDKNDLLTYIPTESKKYPDSILIQKFFEMHRYTETVE